MKLLKNAKELVEHLEEKGCGFNIVKKLENSFDFLKKLLTNYKKMI